MGAEVQEEQVQRCRGTGAEVQRCMAEGGTGGAEMQRCRCAGADVQRCRGGAVVRCRCAKASRQLHRCRCRC